MLDPAFKSAGLPMQTGALTLPVIINIVLITITMVMIIITISGDNLGPRIEIIRPSNANGRANIAKTSLSLSSGVSYFFC